jgi:hypothetical protein
LRLVFDGVLLVGVVVTASDDKRRLAQEGEIHAVAGKKPTPLLERCFEFNIHLGDEQGEL